jgi:hypothetical protein
MNTHADKTQENKSQSVSNETSQKQGGGESTFQFVDNRPEAVAQRKLQEMANNSPQVKQLMAFQDMANNSPQAKKTVQLQAMADNHSAQQQQPIQKKENNTGLPDNLKTGMENLSGMSLDDVKVHSNSDKPAQLQAHAYAQGTDIHLGPGQEKHLPHELGHVVQQKQGRVKATMQMKGKVNVNVNDDEGLEREADVMGAKALQMKSNSGHNNVSSGSSSNSTLQLKVQNESGEILSIAAVKELLKGTTYASLFDDALAKKVKHTHKTTNSEKQEAFLSSQLFEEDNAEKFDRIQQVLGAKDEVEERKSDLELAIAPEHAMYFSIDDIKSYLDGEVVPGLSNSGAEGILGGKEEPTPFKAQTEAQINEGGKPELWKEEDLKKIDENGKLKVQAETIVSTLTRLKANRAKQEENESDMTLDSFIDEDKPDKYLDKETNVTADNFRNTTFYYGTTGIREGSKANWEGLMAKAKKAKKSEKGRFKEGDGMETYNAGTRNLGFLKGQASGEGDDQMMDMYYGGQEFEAWQKMANPIIGKYVHEMMGYAGEYNHNESPDTTFRKNFPGVAQGWNAQSKPELQQSKNWRTGKMEDVRSKEQDETVGAALRDNVPAEWAQDKSGTMEISRLVREAVAKFGGTIVFEGSGVTNQGNFVSNAFKGDTNVEAISMLKHFEGTNSSKVKVGQGQYIFHWNGSQAVPTRDKFLSNWGHPSRQGTEKGKTVTWTEKGGESHVDTPDSWYWNFPSNLTEVKDQIEAAANKMKGDGNS